MVLEFAAAIPAAGRELLEQFRASLRRGPGVLEAVCSLLPGESPRTRAEVQARFGQAPPVELVGLDPLDRNRPHLAEEHA